MKVKWFNFYDSFTEETVKKYVPAAAGVYLLWVKLKNGKWKCIYVGKATNLKERLLSHLSRYEENSGIKNHVQNYIVGFEYTEVATQDERNGIEKFLYDTYQSECNQKDPGGVPIEVNLP